MAVETELDRRDGRTTWTLFNKSIRSMISIATEGRKKGGLFIVLFKRLFASGEIFHKHFLIKKDSSRLVT